MKIMRTKTTILAIAAILVAAIGMAATSMVPVQQAHAKGASLRQEESHYSVTPNGQVNEQTNIICINVHFHNCLK